MKKPTPAHIRLRLDRPAYDAVQAESRATGKTVARVINDRLRTPTNNHHSPQTAALVHLLLAGLAAVEQLIGEPWSTSPESQRRCLQALQCCLGAAYPGSSENFDAKTASATMAAVAAFARTGGQH